MKSFRKELWFEMSRRRQLINITPEKPVRTIGVQPNLSLLFDEALNVMKSGYSLYHLVKISSLIQQALSQIAFSTAYSPPVGTIGLHVGNVIEYMLVNITQRCTLDDFAAQACLSRSYFSRQFRHITGVAPTTYRERAQI